MVLTIAPLVLGASGIMSIRLRRRITISIKERITMPKIRIMGKNYDVDFKPATEELENKFTGRINYGDGKITVLLQESPRSTVLHEVLHYMNSYLHCGMDNEEHIARMEAGLMQVLRDNKDWVRWLLEDDDVKRYNWK